MANRHMKRCSLSLIIKEYKLKPRWDITSHLSEQLSSINQQTTSAGEDVWKGDPSTPLVGKQIGATTVENSMEISQKN